MQPSTSKRSNVECRWSRRIPSDVEAERLRVSADIIVSTTADEKALKKCCRADRRLGACFRPTRRADGWETEESRRKKKAKHLHICHFRQPWKGARMLLSIKGGRRIWKQFYMAEMGNQDNKMRETAAHTDRNAGYRYTGREYQEWDASEMFWGFFLTTFQLLLPISSGFPKTNHVKPAHNGEDWVFIIDFLWNEKRFYCQHLWMCDTS